MSVNLRVLVVDDEPVVRNSFREILAPKRHDTSALDSAASALFGDDPATIPRSSATFDFEVSEAKSGREGFEKLKAQLAANEPYALVFLDVRMPGWDGIETAEHIRSVDPRVEIVFVTAFNDYGLDEVVARTGGNVGYHCKPFSPEEIKQIATKAVHDWNRTGSLEDLIGVVAGLAAKPGAEEKTLLESILTQVGELVGSGSAAILDSDSEGASVVLASGRLKEAEFEARLIETLKETSKSGEPVRRGEFIVLHMGRYRVAALVAESRRFQPDRLYLLRLFTENASRALENADLQAQLAASQKLSALGLALGRVIHDLRQPLSVLKGAVKLTEIVKDDPAQLRSLNDMMQRSVTDLEGYLEDVLDFTRGSTARTERVELDQVLGAIEPSLSVLSAFAEAEVEFELVPGLVAECNAQKLRRAVLNLLTNAVEAPPVAGRPRRVRVELTREGQCALLRVTDNGPGIPDEIRGKLFQPFVSSGKRLGTGLGLAIVHQAFDGGIEVERSTAEGTVFAARVYLLEEPTAG